MTSSQEGPLRRALTDAAAENGCSMKALTALAPGNDPFRVDTPARHRDGAWLATTARELGLGERKIHLRGLHYMVLGRIKPNGKPYANTEKDWTWLSEDAGKAARWLGYLPFEQVLDQRNTPAIIRVFERPEPHPYLTVGVHVEIPDADDITPLVDIDDFDGVQPYKLVLFGEKSSLGDVLGPIAERYQADLYLPTGEISDTLLHQMARVGAEDGRPMAVFCFSDADPSGWQMPVSIARKLQALKVLQFHDLEFQVRRVALTPDQVREYGLPSTPLKDTERRADKWREAMGIEQTEIDALASLRPDLLRRLAHEAIRPFFDDTLDLRVYEARAEWLQLAQAAVDDAMDTDHLERIRADADTRLNAMREEIDALNRELQIDTAELDIPPVVVPMAAMFNGMHGKPLLDSRWPFAEQCHHLIDSKAYRLDQAEQDE